MSLGIYQVPATISLAQSPIMFQVTETNTVNLTSSSFSYIGELYYWTGSVLDSGSIPQYTITKFPNSAGVGLFDLNRIIYSSLTDLAEQNPSNVKYFACNFYTQYLSGSTFVTSSSTKSSVFSALDGYGIFPETIGQTISTTTPYWPLMTDGPSTQSVFIDDIGSGSVYRAVSDIVPATRIYYSSSVGTANFSLLPTPTTTTASVGHFPLYPGNLGFPLTTTGLTSYTIQPYSASVALGAPIRYEVDCIQKYPNVRIKWKNRFGQFDYYNFYMVNRQSFQTTQRTYQPQLGTWEASSFSYNQYDSAVLNYINDSVQSIQVNSWWLQESYNDIFKQLLVSDEIYWIYDGPNYKIRPLTIQTTNIVFKTGVVDKLIQYQFEFKFGQPYKLIM